MVFNCVSLFISCRTFALLQLHIGLHVHRHWVHRMLFQYSFLVHSKFIRVYTRQPYRSIANISMATECSVNRILLSRQFTKNRVSGNHCRKSYHRILKRNLYKLAIQPGVIIKAKRLIGISINKINCQYVSFYLQR